MESLNTYMNIAQFIVMIGALVFGIFFYFSKPDQRASRRIDKIETECPIKHNRINEIFQEMRDGIAGINKTFEFFQRNDFKHIEEYSRSIDNRMAKLEGQSEAMLKILTEVLNKK